MRSFGRLPPSSFFVSLSLALAAAVACSGGDAPAPTGGTAKVGEPVQVASANGCTVDWTKINYDTPGTDNGEFIELQITKSSGSTATTLGDCGLGSIVLINGFNCTNDLSIDLTTTAIPNDGFVVICDPAQLTGCDVSASASGGWIQNGAPDEISFRSTNGTELVHGTWEGAPACLPDANPGALVTVQSENNSAPDMVNVYCAGAFVLQAATQALPGVANVCTSTDGGAEAGADAPGDGNLSDTAVDTGSGGTAGADAGTDAAVDTGAGGSAGASTGGAAGAGTGGTAGAGTGGTAGAGTGGTAGAGTGGTAGAGTGGTAGAGTGGTAGAGTGGTAGAGPGGGGTGGGGTGGGTGGGGTGGSSTGGGGTGGSMGGTGGSGAKDGGVGGSSSGNSSGDDSGCGCATPGSDAPLSGSSVLLGALGLLLAARRRRA